MKEKLNEVSKFCKKIYDRKLVNGISGNVSYRCGDKIIITPTGGFTLSEIKEEDLVIVDIDGNILEGQNKPSAEKFMHLEIYKLRPHVKAIIHTHSPAATTFACMNKKIEPISPESSIFIPDLPMVPFLQYGTKELAQAVAKQLAECNAIMIENHGIVTVGTSLQQALNLAEIIEETALMNIYKKILCN